MMKINASWPRPWTFPSCGERAYVHLHRARGRVVSMSKSVYHPRNPEAYQAEQTRQQSRHNTEMQRIVEQLTSIIDNRPSGKLQANNRSDLLRLLIVSGVLGGKSDAHRRAARDIKRASYRSNGEQAPIEPLIMRYSKWFHLVDTALVFAEDRGAVTISSEGADYTISTRTTAVTPPDRRTNDAITYDALSDEYVEREDAGDPMEHLTQRDISKLNRWGEYVA